MPSGRVAFAADEVHQVDLTIGQIHVVRYEEQAFGSTRCTVCSRRPPIPSYRCLAPHGTSVMLQNAAVTLARSFGSAMIKGVLQVEDLGS